MNRYSLTPLHSRQDLNRKCIELLNEEWPRSDGAREHSQAKSCRLSPPMALLLIENETDKLVGHARICLLPNRLVVLPVFIYLFSSNVLFSFHSYLSFKYNLVIYRPSSCWVESVIVSRNERGKGLGKILMISIESYITKLGFTEVYLSTADHVAFYQRCGYVNCAPITYSIVATTVSPTFEKLTDPKPTVGNIEQTTTLTPPEYLVYPPPCPAPPPLAKSINERKTTTNHYFMYKFLV